MYIFPCLVGMMTLTLENVRDRSTEILKTALQSQIDDPINNLSRPSGQTIGNKVRDLAKSIIVTLEYDNFKRLVLHGLVTNIFNVVKKTNLLVEQCITKMWKEIHELTIDPDISLWKLIVNKKLSTPEFNSLYHTTCMKIVEILLKIENEGKKTTKDEYQQIKTTEEEQKVVRYIAGYVIHTLIQKYKRFKRSSVIETREMANAAIDFLKSLDTKLKKNVNTQSFLEYTKEWVTAKNRGELVQVNDDMFIFIRRLETVVRNTLTFDFLKTYRGEDLRDVIFHELESAPFINSGWSIVARNLGNESLKEILKRQIVNKWIDIRARSYVTSYIQIVKRMYQKRKQDDKRKPSNKAEPAMRNSLPS